MGGLCFGVTIVISRIIRFIKRSRIYLYEKYANRRGYGTGLKLNALWEKITRQWGISPSAVTFVATLSETRNNMTLNHAQFKKLCIRLKIHICFESTSSLCLMVVPEDPPRVRRWCFPSYGKPRIFLSTLGYRRSNWPGQTTNRFKEYSEVPL